MTPWDSKAIEVFLTTHDWASGLQNPLPQDCSTRRYVRLAKNEDTCVLMIDPGPTHSLPAFLKVAALLREHGFRAPEVYATDGAHLALLEDFGDMTYTRCLAEGDSMESLYETAIDVLIALRHSFPPTTLPDLPDFTPESYVGELDIFAQWYYPAVMGKSLDDSALAELKLLISQAWGQLSVPSGLFLKDMHIDNLIRLKGTDPVSSCGLLDFQDARRGPAIYDLTSLLQDSRSSIPDELMDHMKQRYYAGLSGINTAAEEEAYHVTGAQRNIKNLGIFVRMWKRSNQPRYLQFIPRLWENLMVNFEHPSVKTIKTWMDEQVPHGVRKDMDLFT